jgi:myosin heavy subunit
MAKRIERIDIAQNDVFEGIKESAKKAEMEVDLLAKALKLVNQGIDDVKGKAKGMQSNPIPTDVKGIKEQNQLQKDALALAKERERLEKLKIQTAQQSTKAEADAIRLQTLKNRELEKSEARLRKEAKAQADANSAYTKASNRLNELRKSYKDLAVAGNENSTEARKMKREIDSLDKTLKRVDGNVGQFQRNVGNYSSAFSKLSGALGTFGIGLGVGAVFSGVKNFTVEMQQLNLQASRLGVSSENLKGFVSEAKSLGQTFGTEVNDNMVAVNTLIKEFGISQEQAFKLLENGYLSGANAQGDMLDSIKEYSSQVRASGGDANTLINILNRSGKEGIFSDKGVDVVKEFGLRIREQTSSTSDALRNAFGDEFTDRIFKGINDGSMTSVQALEEVSKKMNDATIPTNKLQTVITDTFGGAGEDAGLRFIQTLTDIGSATGDVVDKTDPYVRQQLEMKRLNDELVEAQQSLYESLGGTGANIEQLTLKAKVLFFQNILPAIKIVAKLTAGFLAFKTVTAIANTDFKALISNFTKFKTEAGEGTSKMSGFGNALKGIGWAVAIGLAVELGMKLWDIASGAEQSRANLARLQAQADKALKTGGEQVDKIMGKYNIRIEELNNQLKARKITQSDYLKLLKVEQEVAVSGLKSYIQNANARRKGYEEDKKFLESFLAVNGQILGVGNEQRKRFKEIFKDTGIKDFTDSFGKITAQARMDAMAQLDANINGVNIKLKQYHEEIRKAGSESASTKAEIEGLSKETKQNTKTTEKDTKAIKEKTKAYKDAKDVINELIAKQKEYDDANLAQQNELDEGLVSAQRTNLDFELDAQERELQAVRDKYRRLEDLAIEFGYGQEELLEARLNEENEIRTKYAQEELQSEEEKQAKILEEEKKALDERRNMRKEFVDGVIDEMKRISTEEEKLIDDRIKAEQDLQSNLQAQASAGNISAQQSIVASMEAEKRATLEKQKEQRKQQALDDIKTLYNLINSNISSGDGVGIATTKAIASMGVIKSVAKVFSALTGFAKGTEWRLGDEHKPMFGGVDGHVVRVDSSEAIVKGSLMDKAERAGITSTSELVQLAVSQKLQPNMYAMNDDRLNYVPVAVKQNNDLSELKRELRDIKDTIKNKTEFSIDPYVLNGMVKGIVETQKTGNFSRKNIFK